MKIERGIALPKGYGYAWINYASMTVEAYPIPFNFIARWAREIYLFFVSHPVDRYHEAYREGYEDGRESNIEEAERRATRKVFNLLRSESPHHGVGVEGKE